MTERRDGEATLAADRRPRRRTRICLAAAVLPLLLLPFPLHMPGPFAAAGAGLAVWLVATAVAVVRRPAAQNALLALASVSLGLAAGEVAAWIANRRDPVRLVESTVLVHDPDLGYAPRPDQRAAAREVDGGRPLFDVTYTIAADGLRATREPAAPACRALFFADSFTFGWGLRDGETLPDRFVEASGGLYRAYNFGYPGYGPHQMLRALEVGRVDRVTGGAPVDLVVYQGIVNHLGRAAGRGAWDASGPRYRIADGGAGATYAGPFHGDAYLFLTRGLLGRSQLFRLVDETYLAPGLPRAEDLPLYVAILRQAKEEVERRYGAGSFLVLFWDTEEDHWAGLRYGALARATAGRLAAAGLDVVPISRILPDIDAHRSAYAVGYPDLHPNAAANRRIAQFLAGGIGARRCRRGSGPAGTG